MAEIVAGFAGPVIEVVKWAAQPITRQLNYLCCFSSNINSLKREAEELDLATRGLQERVDREIENVRVIVPEVESWLTKSKDVNDQKDTILDEVPNVKSGCLKLAARFSLSKRAKETTYLMKELRVQKTFDAISQPGPPAATQEILLGKTCEFESRKKFEEEIMAALRDEDANMIGIHGMGGLGKTTMTRRIMNRVLKEHVFDEVTMAVVSQQVDNSNIQVEIGGSLGLNLKDHTSQVRTQILHARLSGTKRILIVLDDIWEGLKLEGLGIPCDFKGCKILVTSRNKDALSEMDVEKVFGMEILSVEDAWFLFTERVGTCVDDAKLNPIAKEVVDECGGLPIALSAVGAALKDEKDECIWKDALRQLRECDEDILNFIGKVYNPLKLSYDFLRSQQAKSLLLLCSLFPEDANIWLDGLTYCCMGLGIFEGILNLEEARNKMRALAKMLKSRSLLLDDSGDNNHVRMHDVVRDVCRIIVKNEERRWTKIDISSLISQPGPPAATHEMLLGKTYEFELRKKFEEEIMATLRDGAANVIGIHGMGGLGKTTMARRIMNRVLKEHVFEEVAMAVVSVFSQPVDNSNIQVEIGGSLGLNLKDYTSQVRAQKLHARLTGMKRILLVLEDIWEGLELEGLGIPCDSKGCKILVTSRNKDALSEMDVEKVFRMEILSVEEAWFLFKERVGTCVDDAKLNPIAKEVVDECGGLPIALIAVGAALKGEKDECIWKDALRQLRQYDEDIPDFIAKVYNPLKLSYDFLRSQQAKSLLLLCSLFPEYAQIPLDRLTYCCMGLGMFEGIINLEGARNKMRALAKMLKSRSLLLDDSGDTNHVRMHDYVCDVCRTIVEKMIQETTIM